jgi:transcriptional regulator EpsA
MSSSFDGPSKRKDKIALMKPGADQGAKFVGRPASDQGRVPSGNGMHLGTVGANGSEFAQTTFGMTADESRRFLRIIWSASQIRHHYELFLLLQGEIQHFVSHQILIGAWGNFRDATPTLDVVSALPGVRTGEINGCVSEVERMLKDVHVHWIANGRRKILLSNGRVNSITISSCNCALHKSMRRMRSVLVHGVRDERDQADSIYLALDLDSVTNGRSVECFFPLVDPLIAQLDVAFRKVGALKPAGAGAGVDDAAGPGDLSKREREILRWIAEGRTNIEIGAILEISSFTVKNHVQRIFKKLGATNRTEAVSKFNQYGFHE